MSPYDINNIRRIQKYLSKESARALVHAFMIGRTDYCNSLLFGFNYPLFIYSNCNTCRMQVLGLYLMSLDSHITPVLCSLHWLRTVKFRKLSLKYFFLLLKLSTVIPLITWSIWLVLKNSRAIISVQLAVLFHLLPLIYGTICPFTSFLRTINFERFKSLLKSIFLD